MKYLVVKSQINDLEDGGAIMIPVAEICSMYRERVIRMSQTELAKISGTAQPNIAAFESGKYFSTNTLARYFDIGIGNFLADIKDSEGFGILRVEGERLYDNHPDAGGYTLPTDAVVKGDRSYMLHAERSLTGMALFSIVER